MSKFLHFHNRKISDVASFLGCPNFIAIPWFWSLFQSDCFREKVKNSSLKTCLMTPSNLGDNQWHVGLVMANWIFQLRRTKSAFTSRADWKQFAAQLMQICPSRPWKWSVPLWRNIFSPRVKTSKRQLYIQPMWFTMSLKRFFLDS